MKKLFKVFVILFFGLIELANSQQGESQLIQDLRSNIQKIEFTEFFFFQKEFVEMCQDSTMLNEVAKKLDLKSKSLERYGDLDRLEFQLTLKLIFNEIEEINYDQKSKDRLLDVIKQYVKSEPVIDERFILTQLDDEKRGIVNGYDSDVTSESRFILFIYDPILLKNTLQKNNMSSKWERMGIFLCNYLRDVESPSSIKISTYERLKSRIISNEKMLKQNIIIKDFEGCAITKPRND